MIAKFVEGGSSNIVLELENKNDGVVFSIFEIGEEHLSQQMVLPFSEIQNLIKFLNSVNQMK